MWEKKQKSCGRKVQDRICRCQMTFPGNKNKLISGVMRLLLLFRSGIFITGISTETIKHSKKPTATTH